MRHNPLPPYTCPEGVADEYKVPSTEATEFLTKFNLKRT